MANDDLRPAFVPNLGNYLAYGTDGTGSAPYFNEVGHLIIQPRTDVTRDLILPVRKSDATLAVGLRIVSIEGADPDIVMGNADPADSGYLYVPSVAGIPSGSPSDYGQGTPVVIDRTAGTLYLHTGAVWEPVSGAAGAHQNLGAGVGIFKDNTGGTTGLRSLVGTGAVSIAINGDTVEIDVPSGGGSGFDADTVDGVHASELQLRSEKGQPGGYASLDGAGTIPTAQIPQIAITNVHVVADITARDALTAQEGDIAKVLDDGTGEANTYIYDGTGWVEFTTNDAVDSVNGQTGTVLLDTGDIAEGSNLYYTNERVDDRVAALIVGGNHLTATYNDAAGTLTLDVNEGSGFDADTVDGLHAVSFLRSDAADTATGLISFNGGIDVLSGTGGGKLRVRRNTASTDGDDIMDIHLDDGGVMFDVDNDNDADSGDFRFRYKSAGVFSNLLRFLPGIITFEGSTVWHAGNDGAASGLDADLLDAQHGSHYLARANHTGTQLASTISDFSEATDDRVAALLQNGTGLSWTYNDASGTLTPAVSLSPFSTTNLAEGTNLYFTDERVDDRVAALVVGGTNMQVVYDDALGTLTFNVQSSGLDADTLDGQQGTYYLARANHTGTQLASTISDFSEAVDDRVAALFVAGANIEHIYDDTLGTFTVNVSQGAGSALDADMVDGLHASSLVQTTGNQSVGGIKTFSSDVRLNSLALVFGTPPDSSNYDHIWYDEADNAFNFVADTTYKAAANAKVRAGSFFGNGAGVTSVNAASLSGVSLAGTGTTGPAWDYVARVKSDGVMEVGRYIDFHHTTNDGVDRAARLHTDGTTNSALFIEGGKIWTSLNDGASSGLDADLLDGLQGSSYALATHKYHFWADEEYAFDDYNQANNLRFFTENATFTETRFRTPSNIEYWDGAAWVAWAGGNATIETLLDGREDTQVNVDQTHRRFRFEVTPASAWPTMALIMLQTTWSNQTIVDGYSVKVETWDGAAWVLRSTSDFSANKQNGIHIKAEGGLHVGQSPWRIEIDLGTITGVTTTVACKRFDIFSNYAGRNLQPWAWNWDRVVNFEVGPTVAGSTVWHAGNDGAASGLDADLLDGQHGSFYQNAGNLNAGTLLAARMPALTGDVTSTVGTVATTIAADAVTNTKLANMAQATFKGRASGAGTGDPVDLTAAQAITILTAADGAGSLLDADLLDGLHASSMMQNFNLATSADLNAQTTSGSYRINQTPVNGWPDSIEFGQLLVVRGSGDTVLQIGAHYNDDTLWWRNGNPLSGGSPTWQAWSRIWNDRNDGAGSGLDADTVDGIQAASFVRSDTADQVNGVLTFVSTAIPLYNANPAFTPGSNELASVKYVDDNISAASDPLTVREQDGTPSVGNVGAIEFAQGTGLVVSNPSANVARVTLNNPRPAANNTESVGTASLKYADVWATNVHSGDHVWHDPICVICNVAFEKWDPLMMVALGIEGPEEDRAVRSVIIHASCHTSCRAP